VSKKRVLVFHLAKNLEWSLNLGGPSLRLYEVDVDLLAKLGDWLRDHEVGFPLPLAVLDFFTGA